VVEFNYVGTEFGAIELSQMTTQMQENAAKQLEEWRTREIGQRVPAESLVRTGRPYQEILEVAAQSNIDLIIIASHGHTSLAHIVLGSTVERVVRYAPCPVLVVRRQEREFVAT
jgi:nucleotide-binding universal stress UspA family protein